MKLGLRLDDLRRRLSAGSTHSAEKRSTPFPGAIP